MNQANLPPLPAAIVAEKRSNWPFLSLFALVFIGLVIIMKGLSDPNYLLGLLVGAPLMAVGLIGMGLFVSDQHVKNTALLNGLTQSELMSMIGRDGETWRSTHLIVHTLDRRFPDWRHANDLEAQP